MDIITYALLNSKVSKITADIAENYDETKTYTSGDYAIFDGVLKKYSGEVWDEVKITDELGTSGGGTAEDITYDPEETYSEGTVGAGLNEHSSRIAQLENELSGINTLVGSGEYDS